MSDTPKNLTGAINRARQIHQEEIAERLRRRQELEQRRLEELNQIGVEAGPAAAAPVEPVAEPTEPPAPPIPEVGPPPVREASTPPAPVETPVYPPVAPLPPPAAPVTYVAPTAYIPIPAAPPPPPVAVPPAAYAQPTETLPTERFVKIRNSIFDELSRYLSGNQYKIYLEIYRETLGRRTGEPTAYFRPRQMAVDLGIGSDQTVYRAFRELQSKGLITFEAQVGNVRGTKVTVCALEHAIERLRAMPPKPKRPLPGTTAQITTVDSAVVSPAVAPQSSWPQYHGYGRNGTEVPAATAHGHERHARNPHETPPPTAPASAGARADGGDGVRKILADRIASAYQYVPRLARQALDALPDGDVELVPALLARLDALLARPGASIANPAGLLSQWLADFEHWRPLLIADRAADREPRGGDERPDTDAYLRYLAEMDAIATQKLRELSPDDYLQQAARVRADIEARHPASREWPESHWQNVIGAEIKRGFGQALRFEEWAASKGES